MVHPWARGRPAYLQWSNWESKRRISSREGVDGKANVTISMGPLETIMPCISIKRIVREDTATPAKALPKVGVEVNVSASSKLAQTTPVDACQQLLVSMGMKERIFTHTCKDLSYGKSSSHDRREFAASLSAAGWFSWLSTIFFLLWKICFQMYYR